MLTKKVNRYYCEHCKKCGGHSGWMKIHEKHCTANPNRACRLCKVNAGQYDYKAIAAKIEDVPSESDGSKELQVIREAVDNCPACILSTLRQGSLVYTGHSFRFKEELKALWAERNEERRCALGGEF